MGTWSIAKGLRRSCATEAQVSDTLKRKSEAAAATTTTPTAQAFGCTFVLAPAFSVKFDAEDACLMSAFALHPGLAILVRSEVQPTSRSPELVKANEALLCADAKRVLESENAGGASIISEALSVELLARAFGARLLKIEIEIVYWPSHGSITDFLIELSGAPIGVSVTRALTGPGRAFDVDTAEHLLRKKLQGVIASTQNSCGQWAKQILHVWAPTAVAADAIERAYARLETELLANTVVLVTVCESEGLRALFDEKKATDSPVRRTRVAKGAKDAEHLRSLQESDPLRPCRALIR